MNQSLVTSSQISEVNGMIAAVYDYLSSNVEGRLVNFGPDTPPAERRNLPWIKTDTTGSFIAIYTWNGSEWFAQAKPVISNTTPPSGKERRMWVGTESEVWLYDGGDGTDPRVVAPTDAAGAMWQVDHNMDLYIPIGVGSADGRTTVSLGAKTGEEKHTLTEAELATHNHGNGTFTRLLRPPYSGSITGTDTTNSGIEQAVGGGDSKDISPAGSNLAHNNMPPVIGVFFIGRTARKFY